MSLRSSYFNFELKNYSTFFTLWNFKFVFKLSYKVWMYVINENEYNMKNVQMKQKRDLAKKFLLFKKKRKI